MNYELRRGKFIVFYGINNLGKTTQAKLLVERLQKEGHRAEYVKYPIYDLHPSGTMLNTYLRQGNPFECSAREVQTIYALNRTQYEPTLKEKLTHGIHIVAEDYTGTGIAWGIGAGVAESYLKLVNDHLHKENLAFLFDGERFIEATETNHRHESDQELLTRVRKAHLVLASEFGWKRIDANLPIEVIHEKIWGGVQSLL